MRTASPRSIEAVHQFGIRNRKHLPSVMLSGRPRISAADTPRSQRLQNGGSRNSSSNQMFADEKDESNPECRRCSKWANLRSTFVKANENALQGSTTAKHR